MCTSPTGRSAEWQAVIAAAQMSPEANGCGRAFCEPQLVSRPHRLYHRDAPKRLIGPDEKFAVARNDRGIAALTQRVHRHQFELRARLEHEAIASLRDRVAVSICEE